MKIESILGGQQYRVMIGPNRPSAADLRGAVQLIERDFGENVWHWPVEVYHVVVYRMGYQVIFHKPLDKAKPV